MFSFIIDIFVVVVPSSCFVVVVPSSCFVVVVVAVAVVFWWFFLFHLPPFHCGLVGLIVVSPISTSSR